MARDYKNSGRRKRAQRPPVPGWLWLLTGLTIGLLVALLVYLNDRPAGGPTIRLFAEQDAPAGQSAAPDEGASDKQDQGEDKPRRDLRFEFYTLLPESEVVIPEQELNRKTPEGKPQPIPPGAYMLQAGSFRHLEEARAFKAELALLGIVASIQNVTINGDTWHRVRIGPFNTLDEINRARTRLREHDINVIPVKVKG